MDTENTFSEDTDQMQESCLKSILRSTKGVIDLLQENAFDIVSDDMADESPKSNGGFFHSWPVFLAGTLFGAVTVFSADRYVALRMDSEKATENLILERTNEEQTLTPVANINIPLVSSSLPAIEEEDSEIAAATEQEE